MRVARLASVLALAFALTYGAYFVFGPTYSYCTIEARPGEPPPPQRCGTASLLEVQRDSLFPALGFIAAWSLAPALAVAGTRMRRWPGLALVAVALLVDASGIVSMGGGFWYALVAAPLLLVAFVAFVASG
jgi:hypothetical protein